MPISGKEMKKLFERAGWEFVRQKGSHAILQKLGNPIAIIPMHKELAKGTEAKLLKQLMESD